jgi:hypothetical protein
MSDELWHHILANLRPWTDDLNGGKVCPYLQQEPLIDKTIFSKIGDIYRCFPKTCVEISTNGAALTDKVIDNLFAAMDGKRHDIWVSHHGINAETLEFIMKTDFERAHANLINILKKSNGRFNIKIRGAGVSRTGHKTYFTHEQYIDYLEKLFRDNNINRQNVDIDSFTFHDRAGNLNRTERGVNELNLGYVRQIDKEHPFWCNRIDEWIHFDYKGNIVMCCHDYKANVKLPNVLDVWLADYFMSAEYQQLCGWVSGDVPHPEGFICARCQSPGG